ncbi:hypothetical protein [Mesorhizobium sp. CN2-181]|uniref:hypothetical protein n=1 Tax=Mesorhizobium yinganensis TaxID=3157707 RepID=UPI0032B873D1
MSDDNPDGIVEYEAINMTQRLVVLPDGRTLPIVQLLDDEGEEVDEIEDAFIMIAGSPEFGYFEIMLEDVGEPVTFH